MPYCLGASVPLEALQIIWQRSRAITRGFRVQRVGASFWRQLCRNVEARCANPVVGYPIVDVETFRGSKIVAPIDTFRKHDVGDGPLTFRR